MSMNIKFLGKREIQVVKTGEIDIQECYIDVIQTPTKVTYEILNSENPVKTYIDWVIETSQDEIEPRYSDDDIFCEREPIRYETVNYGKIHVQEFQKEIDTLEGEGYTIACEVW